jgi:heptaprenyl diphosphate synthase
LALFLAGAVLLPAFLFQQDLVIRSALFLLFMGLNVASGRRPRLLQYVLVGAGIVVFNLVIPTGRVLVSVSGLPITEVALKTGVSKATAMVGLIALSLFSIRSDLRLPGRFGGLLGRSLLYFERIMGERRAIDRRDLIGSIDAVLLSVHQAPLTPNPSAARVRTSAVAGGLLVLIVIASWGALAWTLVHPRPFWG